MTYSEVSYDKKSYGEKSGQAFNKQTPLVKAHVFARWNPQKTEQPHIKVGTKPDRDTALKVLCYFEFIDMTENHKLTIAGTIGWMFELNTEYTM